MSPEAQLIFEQLERETSDFQESVNSWDTYDRVVFSELYARAIDLCRHQVINGNTILAHLSSVIGDFSEFERWVKNIKNNGGHGEAVHVEFMHYVNHGYAKKAQELLPEAATHREKVNLIDLLVGAYSVGAFISATDAIDRANVRGEVLMMTQLLDALRSAATVTKELDLTDREIGDMLDIAGEIIREHRMTWSSGKPTVIALDSAHGGPALSIDWRVYVSPAEAANLTWELTDRLVDRDLDRAGCSIGFSGVKINDDGSL